MVVLIPSEVKCFQEASQYRKNETVLEVVPAEAVVVEEAPAGESTRSNSGGDRRRTNGSSSGGGSTGRREHWQQQWRRPATYQWQQQWRRKHRQARALAATVAETGDVPMAAAAAEETLAGQRWRVGEGWRHDQQRGRAALNARALAAVVAEVHRRGTKAKGGESRGANGGSEKSEQKTGTRKKKKLSRFENMKLRYCLGYCSNRSHITILPRLKASTV
ncbi:hypothetical protein LR48_Vigan05g141200 [Vigna angularis]|uniref:Uncharacterized protein n=1 Tax=Phaseolus angularis TaxID=3914 RepID=A0A0L9UMK2_PHAAN|nr:hypothetical protein LR48_Vigan05g141200 [Vigna angularis]